MDPAQLAAQALQKNFSKFGGFVRSCTYRSMDKATYNTSTRTVTGNVLASYPLGVIFDEFSFTAKTAGDRANDEDSLLDIDRKAIFPALDLPVAPKIHDRIVDPDNVTWRVIGLSKDPGPAHHALHVRPVGS